MNILANKLCKAAFIGGIVAAVLNQFSKHGIVRNVDNNTAQSLENELIELFYVCIDNDIYTDLLNAIFSCNVLTMNEIRNDFFSFVVVHFDTEVMETTKEIYAAHRTKLLTKNLSKN